MPSVNLRKTLDHAKKASLAHLSPAFCAGFGYPHLAKAAPRLRKKRDVAFLH
jgi:hypothetical protein